MYNVPSFLRVQKALWLVLLCSAAGTAFATGARGTQVNNWCAASPIQATAPQQSRPYQAAGNSCSLCHTGGPSASNLNALGAASASCNSAGTSCGVAVNPFCVATAPGAASITAPAVGTSVPQGQAVTFTAGAGTNPDGFALSYTWVFSNGQASATGQSVAVALSTTGTVTATLQVRNSVGMLASGTAPTRAVTVTGGGGGNQAPVATIGAPAANVSIAAGASVTFQGSGTDSDNNLPLTYAWTFAGGSPASSTTQNPGAVTYSTAGTFTASFRVIDSLGLTSASVTRTITVGGGGGGNIAPVATISAPAANVSVAAGGSVSFQGSGTDADNNLPLTYAWTFAGGSPASSTAQNPGAVTYSTAGTFSASFRVIDSLGLTSASVTRTITVTGGGTGNQAPVATISSPGSNPTITQGNTVSFQGSGSDPNNNTPLTYSWSFPGGTPASSTARNAGSVRYNAAGTFIASFVVTDSLGLASVAATRTVTVTASSRAPVARIDSPSTDTSVQQGGTVNFQGTGTVRESARPATYSWTFPGGLPATSTAQDPGLVLFSTIGVVTVTFTVTDANGMVSAPATRTITVTPPPAPPLASIDVPAIDVSIFRNGAVSFQGSGTSVTNLSLTYRWTFAGGSPASSTSQNPGSVRFASVGPHLVTLVVTDSGGRASEPVTRVITVVASDQADPHLTSCGRDNDDDDDD